MTIGRLIWPCAVLIAMPLLGRPTQAQTSPYPDAGAMAHVTERPESELLLLALRLEHMELDVLLPAYPTATGTVLPLGAFCQALGLAVEVDPVRGVAKGFLVSEKRTFHLDVPARDLRVGSRSLAFDSTGIEVHLDDIYVSSALLATWLNAEIQVDLDGTVVTVRSAELLPIQAQRERERRARRDLAQSLLVRPDYPRLHTPRHIWSVPFIDQSFRSTSINSPMKRSRDWEYTTYATAEVLYMDGDLRLNGDNARPVAEIEGGVGRTEADPVLLGPLRARQARVGQVACPGLELIGTPAFGPGFFVTNLPLQQPDQFDRHVFRGYVQPGWDVELYRDDALLGYQASRPDGSYEFDVPLTLGANSFRLVFYGPAGERREEAHAFNVGTSLAPPGQHYYRVAVCDPTSRDPRSYVETSFSLARRLSASCGLARMGGDAGAQEYASSGVRGSWKRTFASVDLAIDRRGGFVSQGGLQTLWGPMAISLRHAQLERFESEVFRPVLGPVRSRTSTRIDGAIPAPWIARIPIQAELSSDRLSSGQTIQFLTNRVAFGVRNFSLSHQMRQVMTRGTGTTQSPQMQNTFLVSTQARRFALRGAFDYDPRDRRSVHGMNALVEGPAIGGSYAGISVNRNLQLEETRYIVSMRQGQGPLGWNVRTEYGQRSGSTVSIGLSVGLNSDPRAGQWHTGAQPVAGTGAASAQVFLDANGNGVRDAGEVPIEGTSFALNQARAAARTGPEGIAFLGGLPPGTPLDVTLLTGSLEDPLWVPAQPGVAIVPRAGRTVVIDFPVRITGEVTGTVSVQRRGVTRPTAALTVELLDAKTDEIVKQATTTYDGSYDVAGVFPGRYALRVAPAQVTRLGLIAQPPRTLEIRPEGTILDGIDLILDGTSTIAGDDE